MTDELKAITSNPEVMDGEPCIAGTRMPVRAVVDFAQYGVDRIKAEYPSLTDRQIADALAWNQRPSEPAPEPPADVVEAVARAMYEVEPIPRGMETVLSFEAQKVANGAEWVLYKRAQAALVAINLPDLLAAEREEVRGALDKARAALPFFRSVILSGEEWSDKCEEAYRVATGRERKGRS